MAGPYRDGMGRTYETQNEADWANISVYGNVNGPGGSSVSSSPSSDSWSADLADKWRQIGLNSGSNRSKHTEAKPLIDARKFFDDALVFYERDDIKSSFFYFDRAMNYFHEIYFNYVNNVAMANVALTKEFKKYIVDRDFLKLIHSHVMIGIILYYSGDEERKAKAIFYYNKAIELSEQVKVKPSIIAEAYFEKAKIIDNGDPFNKVTFDDYNSALIYGLDISKKELAVEAYVNCGVKIMQTDPKKASEYLMSAIDIDPNSNSSLEKTVLNILASLGISNYKPKKYKAPMKQEKTRSDYFTGAEEEHNIYWKGK